MWKARDFPSGCPVLKHDTADDVFDASRFTDQGCKVLNVRCWNDERWQPRTTGSYDVTNKGWTGTIGCQCFHFGFGTWLRLFRFLWSKVLVQWFGSRELLLARMVKARSCQIRFLLGSTRSHFDLNLWCFSLAPLQKVRQVVKKPAQKAKTVKTVKKAPSKIFSSTPTFLKTGSNDHRNDAVLPKSKFSEVQDVFFPQDKSRSWRFQDPHWHRSRQGLWPHQARNSRPKLSSPGLSCFGIKENLIQRLSAQSHTTPLLSRCVSLRRTWRSRTTLVPMLMDGVVNLWPMYRQAWRSCDCIRTFSMWTSWLWSRWLRNDWPKTMWPSTSGAIWALLWWTESLPSPGEGLGMVWMFLVIHT